MKYCADCRDMEGNVECNIKGMFPCYNPKSGFKIVSARKPKCDQFTECFNGDRCETDRERLMAKSREYRCYIVTAVVKTLGFSEKESKHYQETFEYYREIMLPLVEGGEDWLEDYDAYGPTIADKIKNNQGKCQEIFDIYLKPFFDLLELSEVDVAIDLYNGMYECLKKEYGVGADEEYGVGTDEKGKKLTQKAS